MLVPSAIKRIACLGFGVAAKYAIFYYCCPEQYATLYFSAMRFRFGLDFLSAPIPTPAKPKDLAFSRSGTVPSLDSLAFALV